MMIDLLTKDDLEQFRLRLLNDLKELLKERDPGSEKEWIKGKEVRKLLGNSPGTLQNLRVSGRLKFNKVGGTFYYKMSDIQKMLNHR